MKKKVKSKFKKKFKPWKKINSIELKDTDQCLSVLKKKKIISSPWIDDIFKKNNYSYINFQKPIDLYKVKLKDFNFTSPTTLQNFYKKIGPQFKLVHPAIALYCRLIYNEQKTGEWLRFATPMTAMIDSDGVPHLPKLGKALKTFFIETYWSYPKAIFHPHNEFVVIKNDI
jgi:hypothetical protein